MNYTLGMAAKATGKSKTTIQRAISKGNVSAEKGKNGRYSIDPSELHRVFPMIPTDTVSRESQIDTLGPLGETPELKAKLAVVEALLEREREATDELRKERDSWKQQATALLPAPEKRQHRWWPW